MEEIKIKDKRVLEKAISFLEQGKVIVCPTDTIYGFIADAFNKKAVLEVFKIKKRSLSKPIALFIKDVKTARLLAFVKDKSIFSKKRTTFILKARKKLPLIVSKKGKIGLRIPGNKFLKLLLKRYNNPLAQTSVNISDENFLKNPKDIKEAFNEKDILFINGGTSKRRPSRVVDIVSGTMLLTRK